MTVRVESTRTEYHWRPEGHRRRWRRTYIPVAHVPGIGAVRGPALASRAVARRAAALLREELRK